MNKKIQIFLFTLAIFLFNSCNRGTIYEKIDEWSLSWEFEKLSKQMQSENLNVKLYAINSMGNTCHSNAVPYIMTCLSSSNDLVCSYAAVNIGKLGYFGLLNQAETNALLSLLSDENYQSRPAIAECLGMIGSLKFIEPLLYSAKSNNSKLSQLSIIAIEQILKEQVLSVEYRNDMFRCVYGITNDTEFVSVSNVYKNVNDIMLDYLQTRNVKK